MVPYLSIESPPPPPPPPSCWVDGQYILYLLMLTIYAHDLLLITCRHTWLKGHELHKSLKISHLIDSAFH